MGNFIKTINFKENIVNFAVLSDKGGVVEEGLVPIKDETENIGVSSQGTLQDIEENKEDLEIIENVKNEEKEEKIGFFANIFNKIKTFFKNIFSSKETTNKEDTVKPKEENPKNNIVEIKETQKEQDYKELSKEDPKYTVNGKIDQNFEQGNAADCVLLSNLYSLSRTEKGAAIIQDAIKTNYDEYGNTKSYDVYFRGLDKTYNIPVEEYMEAERLRPRYQRGEVDRYLSAGDDDILLMELAYQKAFNDISEAKKSSSIFKKTDALTSVEYKQFLYAFVGTEDVNESFFIEEKYRKIQEKQNVPKILEVFETQNEFKLEDVYISDVEISGMGCNSFHFDWDSTYIIEQKPSESENNEIIIKNKETGETQTFAADFLARCFGEKLTLEQEKQIGIDMYDLAIESDFVYFGNNSHKPIDVTDVNGKIWSICQMHAYGVKEINQDYIILVNPHDSTEEIKISKDEYIKNYDSSSGFGLFSADF